MKDRQTISVFICYFFVVVWVCFCLFDMWFDLVSFAGFIKVTITAIVLIMLCVVMGFVNRSD